MSYSLSDFSDLGVDRTKVAMSRAVEYADEFLGTDHPAVIDARDSLQTLTDALDNADKERPPMPGGVPRRARHSQPRRRRRFSPGAVDPLMMKLIKK